MTLAQTTEVHDGHRRDLWWFRELLIRRFSELDTITVATFAVLAGLHIMSAALFMFSNASGEAAAWDRLPVDDAWTRMTYIRNFSDSFTLQYNSGEAATGATSPLWVVLNGFLAAVFGIPSGVFPALAKVLGIICGIASVWMVYKIAWKVTRKQFFGLLAAAVLAVEPHFAFAAVSGTEVTLFAAVSLAASWAFLRGRIRTAGIFAGLAVAARPEGFLLLALIVGATFARWMWRRNGTLLQRNRDIQDIAWLGLPGLIVIVLWVIFNWLVTGSALPDSYLATNETIGLLPLSNLWNAWLGYLHEVPFMDGLAWVVGLPLISLGIQSLIGRYSFSAVPISLFTLALVYAAMVTFIRPDDPWLFDDRRHLDPAMPFIVILLVVGTARAWQLVWAWKRARKPRSERERKAIAITAQVAVIALLIAPLAALPTRWADLTDKYSWTSRNTSDLHVAMGKWIKANTPEDAAIGAIPSGAISFFAEREIIDLGGKSTHDAHGQNPIAFGINQEVDYIIAFREPFFDSLPGRAVVNEERVSFANPYQSNILRAYGPNGSATSNEISRQDFAVFDPVGLEVIDLIDVGNGFAIEGTSEFEHSYGLEGERASASYVMATASGNTLEDDFRSFSIAEEFTVASKPGEPLTIVKRYDATVSSALRVFADGKVAGTWQLPAGRTFFGEESFTVPAELITENRTRLRFEVIPDSSSIAGNSFFYWILAPEGA